MFVLKVPVGEAEEEQQNEVQTMHRKSRAMIMKKQFKKKKRKNRKGKAGGKHKNHVGVIIAESEVLSLLCFSWRLRRQ